MFNLKKKRKKKVFISVFKYLKIFRGRFEWVSSEDRLGSGKDFGLIKHLSHEQKQHNRINSKRDTMRECIKDDA